MKKLIRSLILLLLLGIGLYLGSQFLFSTQNVIEEPVVEEKIDVDGAYTSKEDVALYIATYGKLPSNFVTKAEAKKMGWEASKGNLQKVCKGCSIGGDSFSNREGILPKKKGRKYYECDIDYQGGTRNAKRIVFSNDGLIYYTEDHYNSYELLYGEP
ncbi:MAG: ribonuclease [Erysipelotrichaceae bacterium]|nr:ribonuclease [Erysipelotrichaceae bacterium]